MGIPIATEFIDQDEKAYLLMEGWHLNPLFGERRVQRIWVLRDDDLAVWTKDLGPRDAFRADRFQIPSGIGNDHVELWAYSVGEIREIADYLRGERHEHEPPSPMWQLYCQDLDEKLAQKAHRTVTGPLITIQRT